MSAPTQQPEGIAELVAVDGTCRHVVQAHTRVHGTCQAHMHVMHPLHAGMSSTRVSWTPEAHSAHGDNVIPLAGYMKGTCLWVPMLHS